MNVYAVFHAAILIVCVLTLLLVVRVGINTLRVLKTFDARLDALEGRCRGP